MTARVVFSVKKQKLSNMFKVKVHNQRLNDKDKRIRDPSKTEKNIRIYSKYKDDIDASVKREVEENYQSSRKWRSDYVACLECVISASPKYFRPWDENDIGNYDRERTIAWAKANLKKAKEVFGENLIDATLHVDESTPHIHLIVTPVMEKSSKDGSTFKTFDAKTLTKKKGKWAYSKLQDEFGEAVSHLGIERGLKGSRAVNQDLKELGKTLTAAAKDAEALAIVTEKEPVRRSSKSKGWLFNKDDSETELQFYERLIKWMRKTHKNAVTEANRTIKRLVQSLSLVTKQLEAERARTEAYKKVSESPQELQNLKVSLDIRQSELNAREASEKARQQKLVNTYEDRLRDMSLSLEHSAADNAALQSKIYNLTRKDDEPNPSLDYEMTP